MTNLIRRFLGAPMPTAVRGEGPYLIDDSGRRYLDAASGAGVSSLGYSEREIADAVCRQVHDLAFVVHASFTSEPAEMLAQELARRAPPDLRYAYFGCGGSESIDGALKIARQYFLDIGEPDRRRFVARRQSYHGNSLGGLGAGGNFIRREPFEPLLSTPLHVAPCYAYRDQRPSESAEEYGARLALELEETFIAAGPHTIAAFIAEPVVAATAGAVPPVPGYFRAVREVCDRHGVLLILDEVFSGVGRTGTFFSCEQDGIVPDMIVLSKSLAAGYQPVSAVLLHARIHDAMQRGRGYLNHGHTYSGHATGCAAALATLRVIEERDLLRNVRERSGQIFAGLQDRFRDHPRIGDIRGRGLMIGLELVADRGTKATFPPERLVWYHVLEAGLELGLICYPMGGTVDGKRGDHILLAPAFTYSGAHVDEMLDKLGRAVDIGIDRALRA